MKLERKLVRVAAAFPQSAVAAARASRTLTGEAHRRRFKPRRSPTGGPAAADGLRQTTGRRAVEAAVTVQPPSKHRMVPRLKHRDQHDAQRSLIAVAFTDHGLVGTSGVTGVVKGRDGGEEVALGLPANRKQAPTPPEPTLDFLQTSNERFCTERAATGGLPAME